MTLTHPKQQLFADVLLFVIMTACALLFWESTILSTALVIGVVLVGSIFFHSKEDITFFIVAAILGSVAEIILIDAGLWNYGNPVLFGLALWAPFFWGFAYLFARRLRDVVFSLTHHEMHYASHPESPSRLSLLLFDASLYGASLLLALHLHEAPVALFALFTAMLVCVLLVFHTWADIFFVIAACIVGFLLEIAATQSGVWTHTHSTLLGMPPWLPVAYSLFSIIVRRTAVTLNLFMKTPQP